MNRNIFGHVGTLLFSTGAILGGLKLLAIINLSWWIPVTFMVGPIALVFLFQTLIYGGTNVASVIDIDPDSHKDKDELSDLEKERLEKAIEDAKERLKKWDKKFVDLARSVYVYNDQRSNIKREINVLTGSVILEEKSYEEY